MRIDDDEFQAIKDELLFSQRRYEITFGQMSDIVFDYIPVTGQIINHLRTSEKYGLKDIVEGGAEAIIAAGAIHPKSVERFREIYRRINNAEPFVTDIITTVEESGKEAVMKISITNILDDNGTPVRAIGVMKDITKTFQLRREKAYSDTLLTDSVMSYEANATTGQILWLDNLWLDELDVPDGVSLTQLLLAYAVASVSPQHKELYLERSSREAVLAAFAQGEQKISFEYLKITEQGYQWYEKTEHIIRDELTGDIEVRAYNKNINKQKIAELTSLEEKYLYENMYASADTVYEIDLTKDIVIKKSKDSKKLIFAEQKSCYSWFMHELSEKEIHPEDRLRFASFFSRESILAAYSKDQKELSIEYRTAANIDSFIWVRTTVHLLKEYASDDLKSYLFIKIIDEEKKEQLSLIYKARYDSLTDLYNKATTEEMITAFLASDEAKTGKHAFAILDIDYFKQINDCFGHSFGDVFLSKTASKIRDLFRTDDILGRVGGDEFIIFMKNMKSPKAINEKCKQLCTTLADTYTKNGIKHPVSVSVGVALYDIHGSTYEELYRNSDSALYHAKEHGRNQHAIYNEKMRMVATAVKAMEYSGVLGAKTFEEHISEYVFRILYGSENKQDAINTVLELIGKHYNASRVYIYENTADRNGIENTFEWCKDGIASQIETLSKIPYIVIGDYAENFNSDGILYITHINEMSEEFNQLLEIQKIKSMVHYSIVQHRRFVGFIGFDNCDSIRPPSPQELSECRNMANVLGIFITEMRSVERAMRSKQTAMSIIGALGSSVYVCDPKTYKILFMNERGCPTAKVGDICYKALGGRDAPCEDCDLQSVANGDIESCAIEKLHPTRKQWDKITITKISWLNGDDACLVDVVDISKYMK